ncbi:MAG: metal ABC transporter substrate-binding protein [Fimbriimonadales bacterium]
MYAATLAVIADWVRALKLPVALLQPRNADAHETPLNVRMVRTALRARAVIGVGGGLEGYLPALERALKGKTPIRTLIDHLPPPAEPAREAHEHAHEDHEHPHHTHRHHAHPTRELHIWFDLRLARRSCELILDWAARDGLQGVAQRQAWRRTQILFRQLEMQMREARRALQGKAYIAVHDAYRPLTQQLGMRSLGSLQTDHERPPSLQAFRATIVQAREEGVAMVLADADSSLGAAAARLLRVPLVVADTLEMPDPTRDYFTRMATLIETLHRAAATQSAAGR